MKKRNGLIKTSLACALIFGGVGLLAGCGKDDSSPTINDIYVTGDYAETTKEFMIGSEVSLAGATVEVSFSDGSKQTVTVTDEMWTKADYDFTTIGEKTITVKFKVNGEEKSEPITIKIVNPASVQEVIDGISTLLTSYSPQAYAESEAEIVRNSYSALSDTDKDLVTNYSEFFNAYKLIKKDVVNTYVELSYYSQDNQLIINGYITTANNAIENATDFATIDNAVNSAKTQIDVIPTEEEITLENAKTAALSQFDYFVDMVFTDSSLYTPDNWALVQQKISEFEVKVNSITDINEIPYINESNQDIVDLVLIDTIASAQYKELLTDLPDVSEVTLEDFNKIESVVEAYEALENDWDKERLSFVYDEIEELYDTVLPLYIDDYKEKSIIELNNYVDLDDYYQEQREYIEEQIIQNVVYDFEYIENTSKSVIQYIDNYIEEAKRYIDSIAPKKIIDIVNKINNLPSSSDVTSLNKLIMKIDGFYDAVVAEIENDEAEIDDVIYTIDLVNGKVYLESTEVATITNNEFLLSDVTYRIIDVSAEVDSILNLASQLSQTEKEKYNIDLQNVNDIQRCLDNLETLKEELIELESYKDLTKYTEEGQSEITSIIGDAESVISSYVGYSAEEFAGFVNKHITIAKNRIDFVKDAVSVAKSNVAWQLEHYENYVQNDYYEKEQNIINEIIRNARLEANQKTTIAEIDAVIAAAKAKIDEVDTAGVILSAAKEEALEELYNYVNVDDYLELENKEDLEKEAVGSEDLPSITITYQNAKDSINGSYDLDDLAENLATAKGNIYEEVRSYEVNVSTLEGKISESINKFIASQSIDDYYVEVAVVRDELMHNELTVNGENVSVYTTHYLSTSSGFVAARDAVIKKVEYKTFNLDDNKCIIYENYVKCDGVDYTITDDKFTINEVEYTITENGLTYGDNQVIEYNEDNLVENKLYLSLSILYRAYTDIVIEAYSDYKVVVDTYTVKVTGNEVESEYSVSGFTAENIGTGNGAGISGSLDEENLLLTSYNKGASLNFLYKNESSAFNGNVLIEVKNTDSHTAGTYYYFDSINGAEDYISIKALGKDAVNVGVTEDRYAYLWRSVKIYDGNRSSKPVEFEYDYYEQVDLEYAKNYYKGLINNYDKYDKYDSEDESAISKLKSDYVTKIDNATTKEAIIAAYTASNQGSAGRLDFGGYISNGGTIIHKVDGNKVFFISGDSEKEVGTYENNLITINEMTLDIGEETTLEGVTGKKLSLNGIVIGVYNEEDNYMSLYAIDGSKYQKKFARIYDFEVVANENVLTVSGVSYFVSVDGKTLLNPSTVGFKEIVDYYVQTINVDREAIDNSIKAFMDKLTNNDSSLSKYVELGEIKINAIQNNLTDYDVVTNGEHLYSKKYTFFTTDGQKSTESYTGESVYQIMNNKLYMHIGLYLEYAKEGFVVEVGNTKFVLEELGSSTNVTGVETYKDEYIESSAALADTNVIDITTETYNSTYGIKFDNLTQKESGYYAYSIITTEGGNVTYVLFEDLNNAEFKIGTTDQWKYGKHHLVGTSSEETINVNLYLVGKGETVERSHVNFVANYNYIASEKIGSLEATISKTKYDIGETLDLSDLVVTLDGNVLSEDQYTIKYRVNSDTYVTLDEFNEIIGNEYNYYWSSRQVVIEYKYGMTNSGGLRCYINIDTELKIPTLVVNGTNMVGDETTGKDDTVRSARYIYEITPDMKEVTINLLEQYSDRYVIMSEYTKYFLPVNFPITVDVEKDKSYSFAIYEKDEFGEMSQYALLNLHLDFMAESVVNSISINDTELTRSYSYKYSGSVDTGRATNVLNVDLEEGYTYKLYSSNGELVDANNLKLYFGYVDSNRYILKIYDSTSELVETIDIEFALLGDTWDEVYSNLKFNDETYNLYYIDVYNEGAVNEIAVTGINEITGLTSLKILDYKGNNLLDSNNKLNMENIDVLKATLEVVIGDKTYYSDVLFINYGMNSDNLYNDFGVEWDGVGVSSNSMNYNREIEVPKGTTDYSKIGISTSEYSDVSSYVIQRMGQTNSFKVTFTFTDGSTKYSYLIVKEGTVALTSDANAVIGVVSYIDFNDDLTKEEIQEMVKENTINATLTNIDSSSEYYDETITNYYVANDIKAELGDCLYVFENNKYQRVEVNWDGDFVFAYSHWLENYTYYRFSVVSNESDNYIIIDVASGDRTVKNRYILEFERK